jgi:GT2 family glycosyltransferase
MDLSVIIVNYNVKHFLEQCLYSVEKANRRLNVEVFVVDNNSVDGSCQMVAQKFPWVKLVENKENVGFARANNQAIRQSVGKYVLLLNPDTFVQEDSFQKCFEFCENQPEMGGLGVKMIDGKGSFLPESKRSLPTPSVAFYKIFGLSSFFPKSKIFGKYHLGFLDKDQTHSIEILSGAYMWLRKSVLDEIGLLDEDFFMYGEDIDLSYRIIKAGYKNYYFADTTIIHYKGESTKKGSINYVMVFYKAMIIFAQKHFSAKNATLYKLLINTAVYFRASLGIFRRLIKAVYAPLFDFLLTFAGFYFFTPFWEELRFGLKQYYPPEFFLFIVPAYIVIWMFVSFLFGGYEKRVKPFALIRAILTGSAFLLIVYALLPESLRFSRALLLLGTAWAVISFFMVRFAGGFIFSDTIRFVFGTGIKRIAVIGSKNETERVIKILNDSSVNFEYSGRVSITGNDSDGEVIGQLSQLEEIVKINKIDELIFCSADIAASDIIETMLLIKNVSADYKIAPPESISIIGSNSINTAGDLYVVDVNSLNKGLNKRKKRMFDMLSGIILLVFCPILAVFIPNRSRFLKNCVLVIAGKYTWVGVTFDRHHVIRGSELKAGVLTPAHRFRDKKLTPELESRMNIMYAKDYRTLNDLVIVVKNMKLLGKQI